MGEAVQRGNRGLGLYRLGFPQPACPLVAETSGLKQRGSLPRALKQAKSARPSLTSGFRQKPHLHKLLWFLGCGLQGPSSAVHSLFATCLH